MNFDTFIKRLEEARDFSRIENAYSHIIYDIFNLTLDTSKYVLIDTSTYKRTDKNIDALVPENAIAVPDFVIGSREEKIEQVKRLGCIEAKYFDKDILNADKLSECDDRLKDHFRDSMNRIGYLNLYKHVIYTNGWIWRMFAGSNTCIKEFDFTKKENQNNAYYGEFLYWLFKI